MAEMTEPVDLVAEFKRQIAGKWGAFLSSILSTITCTRCPGTPAGRAPKARDREIKSFARRAGRIKKPNLVSSRPVPITRQRPRHQQLPINPDPTSMSTHRANQSPQAEAATIGLDFTSRASYFRTLAGHYRLRVQVRATVLNPRGCTQPPGRDLWQIFTVTNIEQIL
jgi:hypothetical protein